jgi:selenoprotein W-related protein
VRTVEDLLHDYQHVIDELTVITAAGGVFDVEVDGVMLFSKKVEGRHADEGEVLARFRDKIVPGVPAYER